MSDNNFFIKILKIERKAPGLMYKHHWHEQIQFYYITQGEAIIHYNSQEFKVRNDDLVIIHNNEMHQLENLCSHLVVYLLKIDLTVVYSNYADSIQTKFLTPLSQNLILFENVVRNDKNVSKCINRIIHEYFSKELGFELSIKSQVYDLIVTLLRGYVKKIYTEKEFNLLRMNLQRFHNVLEYINENFTEKIDIDKLADITNLSTGHFCRLFKQTIGLSAVDYLNNLRINKAADLIRESNFNITEVALACGFTDSNYFSRVFKKYKRISPLQLKKGNTETVHK